jgi:serine/threonine protein kinase
LYNVAQRHACSLATQAAIGLAAVHNIDKEGEASIAHTDISPSQYIKVNGKYKLNDFNRARFIPWSNDKMCPYEVGNNPGKNRSPEEYNYEPQTEKVSSYRLRWVRSFDLRQ